MLPVSTDSEALPDKWFCEMNDDTVNNSCDATEKDNRWYYRHLSADQLNILEDSPVKCLSSEAIDSAMSKEDKATLVENDVILQKLLNVAASEQQSSVVSKYYFHDALLTETEKQPEGDETAAASGVRVEKSILDNSGIVTEAPVEERCKEQPSRDALIKSIDDAYAKADKDAVTIGSVVRSLEAEFGYAKFSKETKTTVRSRLKELMVEPSSSTKPPVMLNARDPPASPSVKLAAKVKAIGESDSAGNPISVKAPPSANREGTSAASASLTRPRTVLESMPMKAPLANVSNVAADEPSTSTPSCGPSKDPAASSSKCEKSRKDSLAYSNGTLPMPNVGGDDTRHSSGGLTTKGKEETASPESDARSPESSPSVQASTAKGKEEMASHESDTRSPSVQASTQSEVIDLCSDSESTDNEVIEID